MILNIKIFYPGGNNTALIDQPVSARLRAKISKQVMKKFKDIEQVGFLSHRGPKFKLEMMGEELCVNAARCAALYWSNSQKLKDLSFSMPLLKNSIKAKIKNQTVDLYFPQNLVIKTRAFKNGRFVDLKGLSYYVSYGSIGNKAAIKHFLLKHIARFPAIGYIKVSRLPNRNLAIKPWVFVPATKSLISETACGSGSIAAAFADKLINSQKNNYKIFQPSGEYYNIGFTKSQITISSKVKFLGTRKITIT